MAPQTVLDATETPVARTGPATFEEPSSAVEW